MHAKSIIIRLLRCRAPSRARQSGMTIVEAVGMTVIMGLMAGLAYPAIGGLRQAGLDQQAIGVAQALNQAQQTYNLRIAGAAANWSAAANSAARYQLIAPYVPFAADTLADYSPAGYTLTLGPSLSTEVAISGPNGTVAY
jgi:type II secretory pathway pseudopilin PulG